MAAKDQTASKASRSWDQYLVKAVFDASAPDWPKRSEAEIRTYEQELNREYECQLFALPSPIAVSGDLKRIINVSVGAMNFRICPPFALNEKKHASGSFVEVAIPEDVGLLTLLAKIRSSRWKHTSRPAGQS
jgi:hypothetical protein